MTHRFGHGRQKKQERQEQKRKAKGQQTGKAAGTEEEQAAQKDQRTPGLPNNEGKNRPKQPY
jgi:hypothetical protein